MTHVESIDARCAASQKGIREAAGRGANIQAHPAGDGHPELVEGRVELLAAARDEARPLYQGYGRRFKDRLSRLAVNSCSVSLADPDLAGEEKPRRFVACACQAALDQQVVQARAPLPRAGCAQAVRTSYRPAPGLMPRSAIASRTCS